MSQTGPSGHPLPAITVQAGAPVPVPGAGATELGLAAMILIWGVNFAVVKRALEVFDPLGFNALRYLLASIFVYVVLRSRGPLTLPRREDAIRVIVLGLVGNLVYQMAFIQGLYRTRAGNASLLLALVPVFILLFSWRSEPKPGVGVWGGVILSVLGVALVSGAALQVEGPVTMAGDILMLGAAAVWALYTVGIRPLITRYGSIQATAWTLWVGGAAIFLAGVPALARQDWGAVDRFAWLGLLYSALLSIGLAYLLWYRGVEQIGGARTAVYSNLTPVVALATGWLWLGESLSLLAIVGTAMVLIGLMAVRSVSGLKLRRERAREAL
jgi:drug/metabolite transporter (DMT)-like permease